MKIFSSGAADVNNLYKILKSPTLHNVHHGSYIQLFATTSSICIVYWMHRHRIRMYIYRSHVRFMFVLPYRYYLINKHILPNVPIIRTNNVIKGGFVRGSINTGTIDEGKDQL